ncbi:alanine racemase [Vreelandella subglaciescola]|jgi:alanine racemase|uniref:Alanine racemase n=1 Tax=Vreelandella subglaciescola TaxID=29571 RepID=A0A1M7G0I7_9GAMM|nr:alanine racemase [Halomonas subglaciescola]SHM09665.1 alanine racemase [Halomonas subglaciescola]
MRPLVAHIDLDALRHNYQLAQRCAPQSRAVAVIKADAYGHGALACARALADDAPAFAVASLEEALVLRRGGINIPIVLLEGIFSADELAQVDAHRLWMAVHSRWQLEALLAFTPKAPIPIWLKVDSGMHRLGFAPAEIDAVWHALSAAPQVGELHLMSHFATADAAASEHYDRQLACVRELARRLDAPLSLANSPATLAHAETHGAFNRPGVMLYGSDPLEQANAASGALEPVMTLRAEIIALRDIGPDEPVGYGGRFRAAAPTRIAVVAAGYGDGYDRHAADGTPVLVNGQRAALAGKVSMDMLTVDVSGIDDVRIGSEVVLWGRAENGAVLSIDEVASHCDTISYTLLTGVLPRVPRRYHGVGILPHGMTR